LTTNQKGTIAELKIAAAAAQLNIPVLRPMTDHCRYDLAFEVAGRLLRVQCKWGALDPDGAVIRLNLQRSWLSPHGYVRGAYSEKEIDAVAVYCGDLDRCYLLPCALIADRRGIYLRLSPPRNAQQAFINLAADFEFDGAVAQLGRATRWQRVGQGFESPQLHSTSVDVGIGPAVTADANLVTGRSAFEVVAEAVAEVVAEASAYQLTAALRSAHASATGSGLLSLRCTHGRRPLGLALALAAASLLVAACGDDDDGRVAGTPAPDHAAEVARNPYAITCGDLATQASHPESARLVIHAEFALAREPALRKVVAKETLNRTGRSVYYALTGVCKGRDPSFKPGRLAVEGVRQGKYRAARNRPG
jgi:PD-(D/E)XK endonuclease